MPGIDWSLLRANANAPANIPTAWLPHSNSGGSWATTCAGARRERVRGRYKQRGSAEPAYVGGTRAWLQGGRVLARSGEAQGEQDFGGGSLSEYMTSGGGSGKRHVGEEAVSARARQASNLGTRC